MNTLAQELHTKLRFQKAVKPSAAMASPMTLPTLVWRLKCLDAPKADDLVEVTSRGDTQKYACICEFK